MVSDRKAELVAMYVDIFNEKGDHPTRQDFLDRDVPRHILRHWFGSLVKLREFVEANHADELLVDDVSPEEEINIGAQSVVDAYKAVLSETKNYPTAQELAAHGITKDLINKNFGNLAKLHDYMHDEHVDFVSEHIFTIKSAFDESRSAKNFVAQRLIVTTAVAGSPANPGFIASLLQYAELNDAQIVVMPCESISNSFENQTASFDPIFYGEEFLFVTEDTKLNENISLCSIQVSAKQTRPITGLSRLGRREGSYVFASPKQFLEYQPCGNSRTENYSIMTPGACTKPNYYSDVFVSKRLSYIADHDHTLGAIIIELEDEKTFHFRQIQANEDGLFVDLGIAYDGTNDPYPVAANVILGDIHAAQIEMAALVPALETIKKLPGGVDHMFLHDVFDGLSINHHTVNIGATASRHLSGNSNLEAELAATFNLLDEIEVESGADKLVVVKSNHDEVIDRYLSEGRYVFDPENHYTALKIATAPFEGEDPLKRGFKVAGFDVPSNWKFLKRGDSYKIAGVECGSHGDLGINGARGSLNSFEVMYGDCVIGHAHSGAIQRGVWRVGVMAKMDMGYNRGPSSWTHTFCLLYENGQRQLINVINGKTHIPAYTIE